jgi:signal transduction histidine kinase
LFLSEKIISRKFAAYFPIYLGLQTIIVSVLTYLAAGKGFDFFAVLFAILSMQAMHRLSPRAGAAWIALFTLLMAYLFLTFFGTAGLAFIVLYTAVDILLGSYALATRRSQETQAQNLALGQELQDTNQKLRDYSTQLEGLAVARARNQLARELHDSVTQTIFSMNLTAQSTLLVYDRDPAQVNSLLERVLQLAQSALSEIQYLITELRPAEETDGGLVGALRRHLADPLIRESLTVSLEVDGFNTLEPNEEKNLFRVLQEALNNIVKHADTSQAQIRLHLVDPYWIEVKDQGRGFDLEEALKSGGVGLSSMRERAAESGWNLQVETAPGTGTVIRVAKNQEGRKGG